MFRHEKLRNSKRVKILSILSREPMSVQNNAFCFVEGNCLPHGTAGLGIIAFLQDLLKKNGSIYYFIVDVIAPVRLTRKFHRILKNLLEKYTENHVVINYGSGPQVLHGRYDVINIDLFAFDEVDIVSDTVLPFKAGTVNLIVSIAALEHMHKPQDAVSEIFRCLSPNGELLVYVPFIAPVHAAPDDYYRWTAEGLRELFKDFVVVDVGIGEGPMSGFLWVFQEWLSILLSFGNITVKELVLIIVMLLTFPLKYLDLFLEGYSGAYKISSGFYIHGRKPNTANLSLVCPEGHGLEIGKIGPNST